MKLFSYLIIALFCTIACTKNDVESDEIYVLVDNKYVDVSWGVYSGKTLNVKIEGESKDWYALSNSAIEGFNYEEGFFYKLLVQRTNIKNPPQDGSSHSYKLLKVIEKKQN